jgi:hypothetical protein
MGRHDERDAQGNSAGRVSRPRTGSGYGNKVNPKVKNYQVKQRDSAGKILFELTRKLWGK